MIYLRHHDNSGDLTTSSRVPVSFPFHIINSKTKRHIDGIVPYSIVELNLIRTLAIKST
jgi:hypothetical protein